MARKLKRRRHWISRLTWGLVTLVSRLIWLLLGGLLRLLGLGVKRVFRDPHEREETLSRWHHLVDDTRLSGQQFLTDVQNRVEHQELPGVRIRRVVWRQHGRLTSGREYLRVEVGPLRFDIAAAPYGEGFAFSWWFLRVKPRWAYTRAALILIWPLAFSWLGMLAVGYMALNTEPWVGALVGFGVGGVLVTILLHRGLFGTAQQIVMLPIVGSLYLSAFRPQTFYKMDQARLFETAVSRAVYESVDALLAQQGLQSLAPANRVPVLGGAFRVQSAGSAA